MNTAAGKQKLVISVVILLLCKGRWWFIVILEN